MSTLLAGRHVEPLEEGSRIGRYVLIRDVAGVLHAISPLSVAAVCEDDGGALLLLPGGRLVQVSQGLATVLAWLDVRG
ncbi:hypothetical protein VQH23_13495 [Pararoseomonas sp. SCSIO 73927]|uniref:hypothetical protein n=1 Tax=Pararoseomonas sp. SCSIO 73927 TaxID=3114537 RepID=UPI0030D4E8D1